MSSCRCRPAPNCPTAPSRARTPEALRIARECRENPRRPGKAPRLPEDTDDGEAGMNAEILTVGSEILAGDILDTNGRDIAQALAGLGILVSRRVSVSDHIDAISEAVLNGLGRS